MKGTAGLQIPESDRLDLQITNTLDQLLRGVRDAAMDVLKEADRTGAFPEGSSVDTALDGLMARILSQDKAIEFFRSGYEQGAADTAKGKPPYLSKVHSDCFDLGYEVGRLARERAQHLASQRDKTALTAPDSAGNPLVAAGVV